MVKTFNKKAAEKLSKKLTNEWKLNKYSRGYFYYQDINKNIFISQWDRLNPANCVKILSHVPTYGKYMVMRAELVKLRRVVTSYVGKPIDYDIACEIVNKLLDDKEQLKKELDELKEKVADQRIDLESSRWYQTVQSDSIIKLRTEVEEREKLNYEAKGIITNQRSEIEKLRGLLRDVYKETENFLIKERAGFSDLGWHQRAAEFDNLLTRINAALNESEEK